LISYKYQHVQIPIKPKDSLMRSFLINKNLCFYYWLKKKIGKRGGLWVANSLEKVILIFGREQVEDRKW
jgi:hypothetical protein